MENLKSWAKARQLFNENAIIFGIAHDNEVITPPESCRYDACIVIPDDFTVDTVEEREFEGGKYAVFRIIHTAEEVQKAYKEIFGLITSGELKMANEPIVENYSLELIENNLCEICVPIL
jgi:DNA gyrase inhibitor GyrI